MSEMKKVSGEQSPEDLSRVISVSDHALSVIFSFPMFFPDPHLSSVIREEACPSKSIHFCFINIDILWQLVINDKDLAAHTLGNHIIIKLCRQEAILRQLHRLCR